MDIKAGSAILRITEKIRAGYRPEMIVLFGSYAKDTVDPDSDIDLLVIKDSNQRRDERDREIRVLLRDIKLPMDIFVYTPEEITKLRHLEGSFVNEIFKKGKVVYERQ